MKYANIVQRNVRVQTQVTAAPDAKIGDIEVCCIGTPVTEECVMKNNECVCTVRQLLYIEFPITFSVRAEMEPASLPENRPDILSAPPAGSALPEAAQPAMAHRPRKRPLLFALLEMLQRSLFPRRR